MDDKMYRQLEDGTREELDQDELDEIIASGNEVALQSIIFVNEAGEERRPYRFVELSPPTFNDDGSVTI